MKTLNNKEFKELKEFLINIDLDPNFINYGGYLSEVKKYNYEKSYRKNILQYCGMYKVWFSSQMYQFDKENGYNILLNLDQKKEIEKMINEKQNTKEYKKLFESMYNCFTYEYTLYSDKFQEIRINKNWWLTCKANKHLNLDSSENENNILYSEVEKKCLDHIELLKKKNIDVLHYEIKKVYRNINFLECEFEYLKNVIVNDDKHPTRQVTRVSMDFMKKRLQDFKEYIVEPTKRKILISVHTWGIYYIEIEKINFSKFENIELQTFVQW